MDFWLIHWGHGGVAVAVIAAAVVVVGTGQCLANPPQG